MGGSSVAAGVHGRNMELTNGCRSAMIMIGGLHAAAALVCWISVSDERAATAAPLIAPPDRGCALPVCEPSVES